MACQQAPSDLRPWKPSDHTNAGSGSPASPAQNNPRQVTGEDTNTTPGLEEVTIASWRANCANCHGAMGQGDGPQAAMFQPRDLGDPVWQKATSDEQIFQSIQKGKNKMPGFALPEKVARNLVALVRLLDRAHLGEPMAAPKADAAASASASGSVARGPAAPAQTAAKQTATAAASVTRKP
ncbi:MAG TPA: cytochrome c [Polyangiaceae bacterium]|nr:cytochrome c [Polyangiaceae bacterium]